MNKHSFTTNHDRSMRKFNFANNKAIDDFSKLSNNIGIEVSKMPKNPDLSEQDNNDHNFQQICDKYMFLFTMDDSWKVIFNMWYDAGLAGEVYEVQYLPVRVVDIS